MKRPESGINIVREIDALYRDKLRRFYRERERIIGSFSSNATILRLNRRIEAA